MYRFLSCAICCDFFRWCVKQIGAHLRFTVDANALQDALNNVQELWYSYNRIAFSNSISIPTSFPTHMLTTRSCQDANSSIVASIVTMATLLNNTDFTGNRFFQIGISEFLSTSNGLGENLLVLSQCLLNYKQELDGLSSMLDSVSTDSSWSVNTDQMDVTPMSVLFISLYDNGAFMDEQIVYYLMALITKMDLADKFNNPEYAGSVVSNINTMIDDISDLFAKLVSVVETKQLLIIDTYQLLFTKLASLSKYTSDSQLESLLRNLVIWRKPIVNLQDTEVRVIFNQIM